MTQAPPEFRRRGVPGKLVGRASWKGAREEQRKLEQEFEKSQPLCLEQLKEQKQLEERHQQEQRQRLQQLRQERLEESASSGICHTAQDV